MTQSALCIEAEVLKLLQLKEAAHMTQQADIKELLESTDQVVGRLYDNLTHSMAALGSCLAILDARIESIAQQPSIILNFQATKNSLNLTEILLPTASTADEQLSLVPKQRFDLSPKDHWYENGVLEAFKNWSAYGRAELLWIGGRSGNQDTWITEMSIDLIDALRTQEITLLFIFCDMTNEHINPATLIKCLIAQILDHHSDIPFHQPKTYSLRRFRRAATFKRLWGIFEALISELAGNILILINHIDDCNTDSALDDDGYTNLLSYLIGLASGIDPVSVIVTSTCEPPEDYIGEEEFRHFYRDTRKSRGKRQC